VVPGLQPSEEHNWQCSIKPKSPKPALLTPSRTLASKLYLSSKLEGEYLWPKLPKPVVRTLNVRVPFPRERNTAVRRVPTRLKRPPQMIAAHARIHSARVQWLPDWLRIRIGFVSFVYLSVLRG